MPDGTHGTRAFAPPNVSGPGLLISFPAAADYRLTLCRLRAGRASRTARWPWDVQRQRGVEARERRIVDDELLQPVLHLPLGVREALLVDGGHHRRRFDAAFRESYRASKAAFVEVFLLIDYG